MGDPSLQELILLCERVLAVEISEQELERAWPEVPADPEFAELRETLFSGLEHLPGRRGSGPWRLDPAAWTKTVEYDDIRRYLARLRQAAAEP